ncbi:hypothetical protein RRG08_012103 [Elysia crispata]|uniref:Uncharacterized protein n=1 Tax=Elysia crispata TaxID=231223 RepID=A0AAE1AU38_9GAST|nr:hypothetical protein RRG08_012103 [Elysia crispata]
MDQPVESPTDKLGVPARVVEELLREELGSWLHLERSGDTKLREYCSPCYIRVKRCFGPKLSPKRSRNKMEYLPYMSDFDEVQEFRVIACLVFLDTFDGSMTLVLLIRDENLELRESKPASSSYRNVKLQTSRS